jgi:hypothetical protein
MRESIKAIAIVVLCVSVTVAAVVWFDDRPTQSTWMWRITLSLLAVIAMAIIFKIHYWSRPDLVPDFLSQQCNWFLERSGLCFSVFPSCEDGICVINAAFQNRYDHPCTARIALRPVVGVFRSAVKLFQHDFSMITFEVACDPGAFGIAGIPLPVSRRHQGKKLTLQIGASVNYPRGKGKMLRFRDGSPVRYDADFHSVYLRTLRVLFFVTGGFFFLFSASVTFQLPAGVAESFPSGQHQRTRILWTLNSDVNRLPGAALESGADSASKYVAITPSHDIISGPDHEYG